MDKLPIDCLKKDLRGKPKAIKIVPYDPHWPLIYEEEAIHIKKALGNNCIGMHHFGSTAVPGLSSKPTIDILAEVSSFSLLNIDAIESLGFEYRGEVIISGKYCSKKNPKIHIHLHIFESGNPLIQRNLDFRNWLREHTDDCEVYRCLKEALAIEHKDGISYAHAKTDFIATIFEKIDKSKKGL